jgi:hypothetical protein
MPDASGLLKLKRAADNNDLATSVALIKDLTDKGLVFEGKPQTVTKQYDAAAGCSSQLPPVK